MKRQSLAFLKKSNERVKNTIVCHFICQKHNFISVISSLLYYVGILWWSKINVLEKIIFLKQQYKPELFKYH